MSTSGLLKVLVGLASSAAIVLFLVTVLGRIGHPFELEWIEGAMVDHVTRLLEGRTLYVQPSLDWAPLLYPPLYYELAAGIASIVGPGFLPLRLLSVGAAVGCFLLIHAIVAGEAGRRLPGLAAAGLFAATYAVTGSWMDLGRVDSLYLFLLLLGVFLARRGRSRPAMLGAGVVLALSFLTKQTALVAAIPIFGWALLARRRGALTLVTSFTVVAAATYLYLEVRSGGWYDFYVRRVPSLHSWLPGATRDFWLVDVGATLPVAGVLVLGWLLLAGTRRRRETGFFILALLIGGIAVSWLSRLHEGGWDNVLLTAYATLAVGFGLAVHELVRLLERSSRGVIRLGACLLLVACCLQFWLLRYVPADEIPTPADVRAGERVVDRLRRVPGEVLVPSHGHLATMSGKKPTIHLSAFLDIVRVDSGETRADLVRELADAMEQKKYAAILVDDSWRDFVTAFSRHYRREPELFQDEEDVFFPVTGPRTRPQILFTLR